MNYEEPTFASNRSLNIVMLWLFLITVFLLVVPFNLVSATLDAKITEHKPFLFLALLIEVSNFIAQFAINYGHSVFYRRHVKKMNDYMQEQIQILDFAERALLREFVLQRKAVINLPINEPTVKSLVSSGILVIAQDTIDDENKVPMMISRYARPYVTYKAIGLTRGKMSDDMIEQILHARPKYAKEVKQMPKAYRTGIRLAA